MANGLLNRSEATEKRELARLLRETRALIKDVTLLFARVCLFDGRVGGQKKNSES